MDPDLLEDRLVDFAVRVIALVPHLHKSQAGKHIANQILRSGTAPAALYAEARSAESRRDFVHKLKISLKELRESAVWLKIIIRSEIIPANKLESLLQECDELCRILNASISTSKKNEG